MTSSSQAWKRPKSPSAGARSLISHLQPGQKIVPDRAPPLHDHEHRRVYRCHSPMRRVGQPARTRDLARCPRSLRRSDVPLGSGHSPGRLSAEATRLCRDVMGSRCRMGLSHRRRFRRLCWGGDRLALGLLPDRSSRYSRLVRMQFLSDGGVAGAYSTSGLDRIPLAGRRDRLLPAHARQGLTAGLVRVPGDHYRGLRRGPRPLRFSRP